MSARVPGGDGPPDASRLGALAPLLLYDGTCGLCDRAVRFAFTHDARGRIRAAPLDGPTAETVRAAFPWAATVDAVLLLERGADGAPRLLARSDAVLGILRHLGRGWARLAAVGALVPRPLRDLAYRGVARVRYRIFGRVAACTLPPRPWHDRLLP